MRVENIGDATLYMGDVLEGLADLEDESVQTCITSPPYWGLRDYGVDGQMGLEPTFQEYIDRMVTVFEEVCRVLRDDGTLWLNLGDSYTSGGRNYRDPGKSKINGGKRMAGLEVKGTRPGTPNGLKPKNLIGVPWQVAFALQAQGWYLRSDIIWSKPSPMPESVQDRPTRSHEYIFLMSKSPRYHYDAEAIREASVRPDWRSEPDSETKNSDRADRGNTQRQKIPSGWDAGLGSHRAKQGRYSNKQRALGKEDQCTGGRNKRTVWTVASEPFPEAHFATFPTKLIEPCVLAGAPVDGVVLDPFAGSGTTGVVALREGRKFIGIELNPDYMAMIHDRCAHAQQQGRLFA